MTRWFLSCRERESFSSDFGFDHYFLFKDIMLSEFLMKIDTSSYGFIASYFAFKLGRNVTSKILKVGYLKYNKQTK